MEKIEIMKSKEQVLKGENDSLKDIINSTPKQRWIKIKGLEDPTASTLNVRVIVRVNGTAYSYTSKDGVGRSWLKDVFRRIYSASERERISNLF